MQNLWPVLKLINYSVDKANHKDDLLELYCKVFEDEQKIEKDQIFLEKLSGDPQHDCKKYRDHIYVCKVKQVYDANDFHSLVFKVCCQADGLFDEWKGMQVLNAYGLCRKVIIIYNNGFAYQCNRGTNVTGKQILSDEFLDEMSYKMAKLHCIKFFNFLDKDEPGLDSIRFSYRQASWPRSYAKAIQEAINKFQKYPYDANFPKLQDILKEIDRVNRKLDELGPGELGLCHNELTQNSIIFDEKGPTNSRISLVSLSRIRKFYVICDLGVFFVSSSYLDRKSFDQDLFPSQDYRLKFLRKYLNETNKLLKKVLSEEEFEKELHLLFVRTNLIILESLFSLSRNLIEYRQMPGCNAETLIIYPSSNNSDGFQAAGEMALKIYKFACELKEDFLKLADDYLANSKK